MELLNKYFGERSFDGSLIELNPDIEDIKTTTESFLKLIRDANIEHNNNDLWQVLCLLSYEAMIMKDKIEYGERITNYVKEVKLLRKIFLMDNSLFNISRIEFGEQGGLGQITNKAVIAELISRLDAKSLWEAIKVWNGDEMDIKKPKANKAKMFFVKNFLIPLYEYLKNETSLSDSSDNEIYRFIKEFCCLAGVEWDILSSQSDPAIYLKKTFHLLMNDK